MSEFTDNEQLSAIVIEILEAENKRLREALERIGSKGNIGDNPNGLWSAADELEVVKYVAREAIK